LTASSALRPGIGDCLAESSALRTGGGDCFCGTGSSRRTGVGDFKFFGVASTELFGAASTELLTDGNGVVEASLFLAGMGEAAPATGVPHLTQNLAPSFNLFAHLTQSGPSSRRGERPTSCKTRQINFFFFFFFFLSLFLSVPLLFAMSHLPWKSRGTQQIATFLSPTLSGRTWCKTMRSASALPST
jgi:hypothetical protein